MDEVLTIVHATSTSDLNLVVTLWRHEHRSVGLGCTPGLLWQSLLPSDAQVYDSLRSPHAIDKHEQNEGEIS